MLSARAGEEASVEGINAGADDYLIKPFSARELVARVEGNLNMARLRKRLAQQERFELVFDASPSALLVVSESGEDQTGKPAGGGSLRLYAGRTGRYENRKPPARASIPQPSSFAPGIHGQTSRPENG